MKLVWRLCASALIFLTIATNAFPYIALAQLLVNNISVSDADNGTVSVGSTDQFTATVLPSTASTSTVTWSSSNTSVATIDPNLGIATAYAPGQTLITATATDGSGVAGFEQLTVTGAAQNTNAATQSSTPPPTCQLLFQTGTGVNGPVLADSISILPGGSVTLVWQSTNAVGGTITGVGPVGPSGSINVSPPSPLASGVTSAPPYVFTGTFSGLGGTANCEASVYITYGSSGTSVTSGGTSVTPTPSQGVSAGGVSPAPGQLVPCGFTESINSQGTGNTPNFSDATGCQACNLAQLVQNLINYAIGIAIPIAAALFAYAGVLLFTAGDNTGRRSQAKHIFKSAFIGFVIAVTAWLVINTLLHVLFAGNPQYASSNWFTIQCNQPGSTAPARVVDSNINSWLSSLPLVTNTNPSGLSTVPSGVTCNSDLGGCFNSSGQSVNVTGYSQCSASNTNCSVSTLESLGLTTTQANTMSCIAMTENAGQAVGCSGTGPCGTFQISQQNWAQYAPASCSAANFGGSINAAQNNAQCNAQTMANMVQAVGYQPWTGTCNNTAGCGNTAYGQQWNPNASSCVANYASS